MLLNKNTKTFHLVGGSSACWQEDYYLSFIDLERGVFGGILPEVMIFPKGLCPEGNIITEGNISTNPPSGGSINDILYRKLKNPPSSE
jgi:hypothetical protein